MTRAAALLAAALLVIALAVVARPAAAELCRFTGTTSQAGLAGASQAGQLQARTAASVADGVLTLEVAVSVAASTWLADVQYMGEEISTWRGGRLLSVAVNTRTLVDGRITRQQWDVIAGGPGGLAARRVQGKHLPEFARDHPGFALHWPVQAFGQPWLADFAQAGPERRPDLAPPGGSFAPATRTPLALTFYWSRFLPEAGGTWPVFLPGFKRDALASVAAGPALAGPGWRRWQAVLRHPALEGKASTVTAWVGADTRLLQLAFDLHARLGSGQAQVHAEGCQGLPVPS